MSNIFFIIINHLIHSNIEKSVCWLSTHHFIFFLSYLPINVTLRYVPQSPPTRPLLLYPAISYAVVRLFRISRHTWTGDIKRHNTHRELLWICTLCSSSSTTSTSSLCSLPLLPLLPPSAPSLRPTFPSYHPPSAPSLCSLLTATSKRTSPTNNILHPSHAPGTVRLLKARTCCPLHTIKSFSLCPGKIATLRLHFTAP